MSQSHNFSVFVRTVALTSMLLGLLLAVISFMVSRFLDASNIAGSIQASANLFGLWLVVSSTIRSLNGLGKQMPGWSFLLAGLLVAFGGILVQEGIVFLVQYLNLELGLKALGFETLPFFLGVGFVAALLSLISLRIRNRFWGNVLEVLIIAGMLFFFFYYMK